MRQEAWWCRELPPHQDQQQRQALPPRPRPLRLLAQVALRQPLAKVVFRFRAQGAPA